MHPRHARPRTAYMILMALGTFLLAATPDAARATQDRDRNPLVVLETSRGNIVIELFPDKAPKSVQNFLVYVGSGFYDGMIFHRVIRDVLIQTGRMGEDHADRQPLLPLLESEADNGLKNRRGAVAMARLEDPNTAAAEFFINVEDNATFDHTGKTRRGWGYAVFGEVVRGMDVVDEIAEAPTTREDELRFLPREPVVIGLAYETDQLPPN
jgi:peptidyl-prolyl cis-trans isomerase B (cyclophilin B)